MVKTGLGFTDYHGIEFDLSVIESILYFFFGLISRFFLFQTYFFTDTDDSEFQLKTSEYIFILFLAIVHFKFRTSDFFASMHQSNPDCLNIPLRKFLIDFLSIHSFNFYFHSVLT